MIYPAPLKSLQQVLWEVFVNFFNVKQLSVEERCWIYLGLLFLEIATLFLLSGAVTRTFSKFMSINFLAFIFLPGVIIHELSHLLVAAVLFVPVGQMEFMPKRSADKLKLGSVEIGRTDPARRAIIGFAPVLVGVVIILGMIYMLVNSNSIVQTIELNILFKIGILLIVFYFLFAVGNTMFSSKKDMEGAIEILITLLIVAVVVYIAGFRPQLSFLQNMLTKEVVGVLRSSSIFLLVPISIDLAILGLIRILHKGRIKIKD